MSDEKSTPGSEKSTTPNATGDISQDVPAQEQSGAERDEPASSAAPIWDDAATPTTQFAEQAPPPLQEPTATGRSAWPGPIETTEPERPAAAPTTDLEPDASPATAGEVVEESAGDGTAASDQWATGRDTAATDADHGSTVPAASAAPAAATDAHVAEDPTPAEIRAC